MSRARTSSPRRFATAVAGAAVICALAAAGNGSAAPDAAEAATGCATARPVDGGDYKARLIGTNANDCLRGGNRRDRIRGLRGRDRMDGGPGDDRVNARDGFRDLVHCGGGEDVVLADTKDVLSGCESQHVTVVDPPPPPSGNCAVDAETLSAPGCALVKADTGQQADPVQLWGALSCESADRVQRPTSGGDKHVMALGDLPSESFFRQLTVRDGDDYYGERCELGKNEHRYGTQSANGTFMTYGEGEHRITFFSVRIPSSLPLETSRWQTIAQMKQAQPSANGGGSPILELQLRNGQFYLDSPTGAYWETDATPGIWTRIALDVHYSRIADRGSVAMYVDANGDGDASDAGEQSGVVQTATLKEEIAGGTNDGVEAGESIPSHLRLGVYHDTAIPCITGCSIDVDNVEVVK